MKKQILTAGTALLYSMVILTGCKSSAPPAAKGTQTGSSQGTYQKLDPEEAKKMMDSEKSAVIVDVRSKEEYEEKHITGAILIPNETIGDVTPKELPDKDAPIFVYCRTGVRSKEASEKLLKLGYTNIYDIGGITSWPYDNVTSGSEAAPAAMSSENPSFSSFTATDLDGNQVDQSIFKDHKLTMINIWATFCGPCLREMPELGEINKEYADKGFQIVGIVIDTLDSSGSISQSQVDTAKEIVDKTGADYLHLLPSNDLIEAKLKDVSAVPETIFVDEDGNIVGKSFMGSKDKSSWIKVIDQYLEEIDK